MNCVLLLAFCCWLAVPTILKVMVCLLLLMSHFILLMPHHCQRVVLADLCVHVCMCVLYINCLFNYTLSLTIFNKSMHHSQPSGWQITRVLPYTMENAWTEKSAQYRVSYNTSWKNDQLPDCYCLLAVGLLSIISKAMVCLPVLMWHLIHLMWTACPMG